MEKELKCPAAQKYSKDKWRLMYVLDHAHAETEMHTACVDGWSEECWGECGRWATERVMYIKKLTGIIPSGKEVNPLRTMLGEINFRR